MALELCLLGRTGEDLSLRLPLWGKTMGMPRIPSPFHSLQTRVQHVLITRFVPPLLSCGLVRERQAQCLYILQGQREELCPCSLNLTAEESEDRGAQHAHRCSCCSNAFSRSLFPLGFEIALCKILTAFFEVTK